MFICKNITLLFFSLVICLELFETDVYASFCGKDREDVGLTEKVKENNDEPIKISELNFEVIKMDSIEKQITTNLMKAQHILEKVLYPTAFLFTLLPHLGGLLLGFTLTVKERTSRYNSVLSKTIVNAAEKLDLENNINHFLSTMKYIDKTLNRIVKNQSIDDDSHLTIMCHDLEIEIENFDRNVGVYKKYPLISLHSLFVLYAYVIAIEKFLQVKKPHLVEHSQMTCDMTRMLNEYRTLIVYERLNSIDVTGAFWFYQNKDTNIKPQLISKVVDLSFNANGYIDPDTQTINCNKIIDIKTAPKIMTYINDSNIMLYNKKDPKNIAICLEEYMKYARHEIENFFEKEIALTSDECSKKFKELTAVN